MFGNVNLRVLKITLRGFDFDLQDIRAEGDEIKAAGSGQIVIRHPAPDSVLNLKATIQPGGAPTDATKPKAKKDARDDIVTPKRSTKSSSAAEPA